MTSIATRALVGNDDAVEGTGLGAAARETNNDHDVLKSCGWWLGRWRFRLGQKRVTP